MSRVTRKKAAEIAEQLHVDEDAVLDMNAENAAIKAKLATPEPNNGRSPLGEIAPNSAESRNAEEEPIAELKKSTRGRKAGKKGGAKSKKNALAASTATTPEEGNIVPDDDESAPSPASETAAEELISTEPERKCTSQYGIIPEGHMTLMQGCDSVHAADVKLQDRSQSPPSAAVRLTRSQLAKKAEVETEPKSLIDGLGQTPQEQEGYFVSDTDTPTMETPAPTDMSETVTTPGMEGLASPLPTAVPNVIKNLRMETPAKRSTSNKENVQPETEDYSMASPQPQSSMYDALEDAVVSAATPPRSEAHPSPAPQDPIAALDDLEDAVENVNKDIPEVQTSPEKKKVRVEENTPAVPAEKVQKVEEKKPTPKKESKKTAPTVRTTKASQARLSMAQNKDAAGKAPSVGRPRPSTMLGRASSVRQSVAPKAEGASKRVPSNPTTSAAARPKSLKASTNGEPREKKETVIPHSKPRPISLSFPTPPPPPKSKKPTTQGSFQLPGEAVAAKLKAAREARMAKEAEEAEKKEKKVAFKARPAPKAAGDVPAVRQTNASRARESIMTGKPAPAPSATHKRSNTVANTTTDRPRTTLSAKPATTVSSKPRASTSLANISKPRASTSTTTAAQRITSSSKGKEVFSRAANAKAAAEKEKSEKEAAAKKARAEASERGRVASREWAEKQRLRKLGIKPESVKKATIVEKSTVVVETKAQIVEENAAVCAQDETTAGAGAEIVAAALAESEEFEAAAA